MIKYEPRAGERIEETAKNMLEMACTFNTVVEAIFNCVTLKAVSGDTVESIIEGDHRSLSQRPKTKHKNPYEGRKERLAELLATCGPMTVKDSSGWAECRKNNTDPYGARIVSYSEDWARLMESGIPREEASHLADYDGITGFMYGAAVSILSQVWRGGEELRKWHNKTYGHEGDGVVNPAVITMEVEK